jgi:hypothetical protein
MQAMFLDLRAWQNPYVWCFFIKSAGRSTWLRGITSLGSLFLRRLHIIMMLFECVLEFFFSLVSLIHSVFLYSIACICNHIDVQSGIFLKSVFEFI